MFSIASGAPAGVASCVLCGKHPRACGGQVTRCMPCIRAYVDSVANDRKVREARRCRACGGAITSTDRRRRYCDDCSVARREKRVRPPPGSKACQSCGIVRPLADYSAHHSSFDGQRHDCKSCARKKASGRARRQ